MLPLPQLCGSVEPGMLDWRSQGRVRNGRAGDAMALAELFGDTWRGAYAGIIPHAQLESIIRRRGRTWWSAAIRNGDSLMVVEHGGHVSGYATYGAARNNGPHQGEIYELYIAPDYQGLGLGEHLFEACRARLDLQSRRGLIVWALSDNAQAGDFYWRRGGRPFAKVRERIGQVTVEKIAYTWD